MPDVVKPRDEIQAKALIEARMRRDRDAVNDVFNKYLEIASKVSDASVALGQAIEKIIVLDRMLRQHDNPGALARMLRVKVIMGVVFPARQHLDRLVARMKACASARNDVLADVVREKPVFE
jgi:hypothetical protein